jgi:F0F1-type ATP synthase membrane subunit c/vacuolar-type H+-ATPase subunit K
MEGFLLIISWSTGAGILVGFIVALICGYTLKKYRLPYVLALKNAIIYGAGFGMGFGSLSTAIGLNVAYRAGATDVLEDRYLLFALSFFAALLSGMLVGALSAYVFMRMISKLI